jgi:hexosaminidase
MVSQIMARDPAGAISLQGVPISISDAPTLRHRGVMMDTARHFLPIANLKRVVDGASASGLNALHLHLTDAESFPLEVPSLPELAGKGAYSQKATYTAAALTGLVEYASDRGVVIIPEIDVPGHAYSWGAGYPNTTASCPGYEHNINNIPLNPAVEFAAVALQATLEQVASIFPSELIHIGVSETRMLECVLDC